MYNFDNKWSLLLTIAQEADHGHPLVIALIFLLQTNCTIITTPIQPSNPEDRPMILLMDY